jgi:hypothetical protein
MEPVALVFAVLLAHVPLAAFHIDEFVTGWLLAAGFHAPDIAAA